MTIDQVTTSEEATTSPNAAETPRPRRRGFAAMSPDRVKELASRGGRAAHAAGTAHEFTHDEAKVAGKKGGTAAHVRRGKARQPSVSGSAAAAREAIGAPSER